MSPGGPAARMPLALLLLWLPDCFRVRGPSIVWGTVGGSLSVQCRYDENLKAYNKFWCRKPRMLSCDKIVETEGSEREVRSGRVSIRDGPANLTFTVTVDSLTLEDAGSYLCGVNAPWAKDPTVIIEVFVLPGEPHTSTRASWRGSATTLRTPTSVTTARTSTTITNVPAALPTSLAMETATSSQDPHQGQGPGLPLLLSLLALLLLLLLVGASLLAWRKSQKRVKGDHSEQSRKLRQAAEQSELCYANLQLHTWSLRDEPPCPKQVEVEYSTVAQAQEDLHYASVEFDSRTQDSSANWPHSRRPQEEPQYSVIRAPRDSHLSPHPCPP